MLRLTNLSLPLGFDDEALRDAVLRRLRLPPRQVRSISLARRSIDARDKADIHWTVSVDVALADENAALKRLKPGQAVRVQPYAPPTLPRCAFERRPLVVGAGPAGLFAALTLARAGARPILIERGRPVDERAQDVERLRLLGTLNPESNVLFGEGGAGTFSDGKLNTGIKSPWSRFVLETFAEHGAPGEILVDQLPHIGTDRLRGVVASIRREILRLGGDVRFSTRLKELTLHGSRVTGALLDTPEGAVELNTDCVLLCTGHSARDTLQTLFQQGVRMVPKPFAMGVRIEQLQASINRAQYGAHADHTDLGAAPYKLHTPTPDGRGVYTFCMCPGGEVMAAASQPGGVVTNGMSLYARSGVNANAAVLVGVTPADFGDDHPLSGFVLQRTLEQAAFRLGDGGFLAPAQRVEDFLAGRPSSSFGEVRPSYRPGVTPANLQDCLPEFISRNLAYGLRRLDGQLHGFAHPDAVLTGVESRSSSPVRLPRTQEGMAEGLDGLFPAGEGAGYAGGIVSAAVDGIRAALSAMERSTVL